jgi:predicted nucleic acid-binding protein
MRACATTNTYMGEGVRIADTSFLYAVLSTCDRFHDAAAAEAVKPDPILIPAEIFSETLALVHYRRGFKTAKEAGGWLRAQRGVQIAPSSASILERAWTLFVRKRGRVSYPDAVVLSWCTSLRATPLAYDKGITG